MVHCHDYSLKWDNLCKTLLIITKLTSWRATADNPRQYRLKICLEYNFIYFIYKWVIKCVKNTCSYKESYD